MDENKKELNILTPSRLIKPPRNIKGGLVGLTNTGKTSIFNLLTNSTAFVNESLFTTIGYLLTSFLDLFFYLSNNFLFFSL